MFIKAENLTDALVVLSQTLMKEGINVTRRGFFCREIPQAVLIEIANPVDRYVRIPERKWNKVLGWVESLWLARGDNSLEMPAAYVKNLKNFSDDGEHMRAGYGPRLRRYGDNMNPMPTLSGDIIYRQYKDGAIGGGQDRVDQLRFVIEKFKQDIDTREAVITIHDPVADDFNAQDVGEDGKARVLQTKDTPCTRSIHFMVVNGKMNCYVDIRSNDLIWGFSAVNVFNFTLMQEYVAAMVGVPVGKYYHKADNLHVYADFIPLVQRIADNYLPGIPSGGNFTYKPSYKTLEDFDTYLTKLSTFEELCRGKVVPVEELEVILRTFTDQLFNDWAKVFFTYWTKVPVEFANPFLNELFVFERDESSEN